METFAVVAACDFNVSHFQRLDSFQTFDGVYAVDAGYNHLQAIRRAPDVVLGDFDSLGYVPEFEPLEVYSTHKSKSDLELAFERLRDRGAQSIYVYGGLGGRLDHTLANLQVAARFAEGGMAVKLVGLDYAVRIVVGPDEYTLPTIGPGTVSVFAASERATGVTISGLEYPLHDAELSNRTSLGLSNELVGHSASVEVREGTLFVFHPIP